MVPKQKSQKFPRYRASTQTAAPTIPVSAPTVKPARRPMRFIRSEAGSVESAPPITQAVTGSVARALFAASA